MTICKLRKKYANSMCYNEQIFHLRIQIITLGLFYFSIRKCLTYLIHIILYLTNNNTHNFPAGKTPRPSPLEMFRLLGDVTDFRKKKNPSCATVCVTLERHLLSYTIATARMDYNYYYTYIIITKKSN